MGRCRGVVCTAGFESVSEAMWLGKPVCMAPTPGHYEQRCNARRRSTFEQNLGEKVLLCAVSSAFFVQLFFLHFGPQKGELPTATPPPVQFVVQFGLYYSYIVPPPVQAVSTPPTDHGIDSGLRIHPAATIKSPLPRDGQQQCPGAEKPKPSFSAPLAIACW